MSHQGKPLEYWIEEYERTRGDPKVVWAIRDLAWDHPEQTRRCVEFLLVAIDDKFYNSHAVVNSLGTALAAKRSPRRGPGRYTRPADLDDLVARALPPLIRECTAEDPDVRAGAIHALRSIQVATPAVVTALVKQAQPGSDPHVRLHALAALRELGPGAAAAVPALLKVMGRQKAGWEPRIYAAEALADIAPERKEVGVAVRTLVEEAGRANVQEQLHASERLRAVLGKVGGP